VVFHIALPEISRCIDLLIRQTKKLSTGSVEIVIVSNGCNDEEFCKSMLQSNVSVVLASHNFLPSEGRNIGAYFARGSLIAFVDSDGLPESGYIDEIFNGFRGDVVAIRGRVQSTSDEYIPPHYDLGQGSVDVRLNVEGNMAIRRSVFRGVGGFDPLMYGHEGHDLTDRILKLLPNAQIKYCPDMVLRHEFAVGSALDAKRQRQSLGDKYRRWLSERTEAYSLQRHKQF